MYIHVPHFLQILKDLAMEIKERKEGKIEKKTFHKPSAALGMNLFLIISLKGTYKVKNECLGHLVIPLALCPFTCMLSPHIFSVPMNMIWHWISIVDTNSSKARFLVFTTIPQFVRENPCCNCSIDRFRVNLKLESFDRVILLI